MATVETTTEQTGPPAVWPDKYDLFGVHVSGTTYDEALEAIVHAAENRESSIVSLTAVHAVVTASCDPELKQKVNRFHIVGPVRRLSRLCSRSTGRFRRTSGDPPHVR